MSLTVEVSGIVADEGTIVVAEGVVVEDPDVEHPMDSIVGRHVRFGGDWRPMREVEYALERGEEVRVEVEAWQLL